MTTTSLLGRALRAIRGRKRPPHVKNGCVNCGDRLLWFEGRWHCEYCGEQPRSMRPHLTAAEAAQLPEC